MDRIIKFRGQVNNIYGEDDELDLCYIYGALRGEDGYYYIYSFNKWHMVDKKTIGQYVGQDINGEDLYENDKVLVKYRYDGEEIKEETTISYCEDTKSFSPFNWNYCCDECDCNTEIISIEKL